MRSNEIDYRRMAELHVNKIDETVGIYAFAFLDAAAKIFEHGICDFAPYPGMFCIRHGLELFVKQTTVYLAYELRDKSLLYRKNHKLLPQWEAAKPHLEEVVEEGSHMAQDGISLETIARIDCTIRRIDSVDPGGMLYRYPEDIVNGKRIDTHFPDDQCYLPEWQHLAIELLADCQALEYFLGQRCGFLKSSREDWGTSLYDVVVAMPDKVKP
jgi:hypothetical protein